LAKQIVERIFSLGCPGVVAVGHGMTTIGTLEGFKNEWMNRGIVVAGKATFG
jgi:hypothetical protein